MKLPLRRIASSNSFRQLVLEEARDKMIRSWKGYSVQIWIPIAFRGFFAQFRPGFIAYSKAIEVGSGSNYSSTTRFAGTSALPWNTIPPGTR